MYSDNWPLNKGVRGSDPQAAESQKLKVGPLYPQLYIWEPPGQLLQNM